MYSQYNMCPNLSQHDGYMLVEIKQNKNKKTNQIISFFDTFNDQGQLVGSVHQQKVYKTLLDMTQFNNIY